MLSYGGTQVNEGNIILFLSLFGIKLSGKSLSNLIGVLSLQIINVYDTLSDGHSVFFSNEQHVVIKHFIKQHDSGKNTSWNRYIIHQT